MVITCRNCGFDNLTSAHLCIKCHTSLEKSKAKLSPASKKPVQPNHPTASSSSNLVGTILGKQAFGQSSPPPPPSTPPPVPVSPPTFADSSSKLTPPPLPTADEERKAGSDDILKTIPCPDCGFINIAPRTTCIKCQHELTSPTSENNVPLSKPNEKVMENEEETKIPEGPFSPTPQKPRTIDPYRMRVSKSKKCYMLLVPKIDETIISQRSSEFELSTDESVALNRDNIDQSNPSITGKVQAELSYENGRWFLIDHSEQQTTFIQVAEKIEIRDGDMILMGDRKLIFKTEEEEKKRRMTWT